MVDLAYPRERIRERLGDLPRKTAQVDKTSLHLPAPEGGEREQTVQHLAHTESRR